MSNDKCRTEYSSGPVEMFEWGCWKICGKYHCANDGVGKDVILYGKSPSVLLWKERIGIHTFSMKMLDTVMGLKLNIKTLIIGNGCKGVLEVSNDVIEEIKKKIEGVKVIVKFTQEAVRVYNKLFVDGNADSTVFLGHSTC